MVNPILDENLFSEANITSSSESDDPFTNPTLSEIQDEFFLLLNQRQFARCESLLASAQLNDPFLEWLAAILYVETNHWDEAERTLLTLSRCPLHPRLMVRVLNELGIAADYLGRFNQASEHYTAALKLLVQLNEPIYQAKVLKNRAIAYIRSYELGQAGAEVLELALNNVQAALPIFQLHQERHHERHAWNELGTVYKAMHQWSQALTAYQTAQTISEELSDWHSLAVVLKNIGEIHLQFQEFDEAREFFLRAIQLFKQEDELYEKADALSALGDLYIQQNYLQEAKQTFDQAMELIESLRQRLKSSEVRIDFFSTQLQIYGKALHYALSSRSAEYAFAISERARARSFLELLGVEPIHPPRSLSTHLLEQERQLRQSLRQAHLSLRGETEAIERSLLETYREMSLVSPHYASLRTITPVTTRELLANVPSDTTILSWYAMSDSIVGFVANQNSGVQTVELPIKLSTILASSLTESGFARSLMPSSQNILSQPWLLEKLHSSIVAPLLKVTPPCQRLVLIPFGLMHRLPLHAAYDRERQQYLCDQYDILYAPSAAIQTMILAQRSEYNQERSAVLSIAPGARDLRFPVAEARAVAQAWNGSSLIADEATCQQVLQRATSCRVLHVAGHAHFYSQLPLLSGIEFADKHLTAWDFLQIAPLGCDLVFVNGCESGISHVQSGDEWTGLVQALLYAAAPSLLLTLWKIDDLAARTFAHIFYQQLYSQPPNQAERFSRVLHNAIQVFRRISRDEIFALLRQDGFAEKEIGHIFTQLPSSNGANKNEAPFAHPYFWAPYVLNGESWHSETGSG